MKRQQLVLSIAIVALVTQSANAHFPWLAIDKAGKLVYFFGETPEDRTYKLPGPIAKAEIYSFDEKGKRTQVKTGAVETDKFVGLESKAKLTTSSKVESKVTFGIYNGSRLDYYTYHQPGKLPKSLDAYKATKSKLDMTVRLIDTDAGVDAYVLWKGKPLPKAKVHLFCDEGHEEGVADTDKTGKVSFTDKQVEDGLNGIMVGHTLKSEKGKVNGEEYESAAHYLTVTFTDSQDFEKSKN